MAQNRRQLWVPVGFAHGFVVVSDVGEVLYKTANFYDPAAKKFIVWNDSELAIDWPVRDPLLCERDARAAGFSQSARFP